MDHNPQSRPETEKRPAEFEGERRRPFVEPEITAPVDVLEATTFFNSSTSGGSN